MSKLFFLNGIASPGRVNLIGLGTVNLEDLSDDKALELYKKGCPYLAPTPEGFKILYPDAKPIQVSSIEKKVTSGKRRTKK
jgi:hypothetical protein